jgi:CRP-like cAMP-binding protein
MHVTIDTSYQNMLIDLLRHLEPILLHQGKVLQKQGSFPDMIYYVLNSEIEIGQSHQTLELNKIGKKKVVNSDKNISAKFKSFTSSKHRERI